MNKNIVLFGFMGTGKTTVAERLSLELNMQFVEMDSLIEEREGMSINDIFALKGQPYFRQKEVEIAKELSTKEGLVISTGGEVVLDPKNIDILEKNGTSICLTADSKEIYDRVKDETHRPLLNIEDPVKKIEELLAHRKPFYGRIKNQIDTTGKSIQEVIDEIKTIISS